MSWLQYVWSDQHGRRVQVFGDGAGERVRLVASGGEDGGCLAFVGTADRVTGVVGFDLPRQFRKGHRLVEAHAGWAAVEEAQW